MKIIFATGNKNKMTEIRQILRDLGMEILSMKEAGVDIDIVEDGKSFEENAMIKASAIAELPEVRAMDAIVLADDSGLEIDYLNKEPGIYSARYAGTDTSYDIKNSLLLSTNEGRTGQAAYSKVCLCGGGSIPERGQRGCPWNDGRMYWLRRSPEQMDLATIRSFSCRNTVVPRQSLHRKRRMNSATEEKRFG